MRFTHLHHALFLAILAIAMAGTRVHAQANVTENQTTYLYVDATNGSDGFPGTGNSPLKTIQAATSKANSNNQKGIGTKVIVNPGVYREYVAIEPVSGKTSAAITLQAAVTGTAIIDAADVLSGWSEASSSPLVYKHSWDYNFGTCAIPSGWPSTIPTIARRTEMVFVNSIPITEVMASSQLRPGTFYVDESDNEISLAPPSGTNMSTAVIEAAVRPQTLTVDGRSNIVLRGLVLRHAATCINASGANITNNSNILIDGIQAVWNNWGGMALSSNTNATVENSVGSYNGGVGFQGFEDINTLYSYNQTDYNNWRGAQGALYDWGMGGTKMWGMRTVNVQNQYSYANQAQGLWFDTDNENVTINNATLSGNDLSALQIERNQGPVTLTNSKLCSSSAGVNVLTSEKVSIKDNVFYDNSGTKILFDQAEIFIAGTSGGQVITNWQTGGSTRLFTTGMVLTGNTFEDASSGQNVFGTYLDSSDWSDFANSLNASNNRWYDPTTSSNFQIVNGHLVTLGGFNSATGTDYDSVWAKATTSPTGACAVPNPAISDFAVDLNAETYSMTSSGVVVAAHVKSYGTGTVTLSVTGLPSGVSASLSQSSLVSGVVNLTLKATDRAARQKVPITLWAVSGSRVHSVTFDVQVEPS
jgi:hypothetical protein